MLFLVPMCARKKSPTEPDSATSSSIALFRRALRRSTVNVVRYNVVVDNKMRALAH